MTSEALRNGEVSEQVIRDALTTCRGDIFKASGYLNVSPTELDRYIRASEELQGFAAAIATVKKNANYDRMSSLQFKERLEQVTLAYRLEATEIIHELALITPDSAAMAEVKLKAAMQLRGSHTDAPVTSETAQVLAELNRLYSESAPRIKSVRIAAQIEFQDKDQPTGDLQSLEALPIVAQVADSSP